MISKYKAIIFDWDGTLVDSHDWVLGAHNHVRQIMGKPLWTKNDIFGNASFSARETYPREYGDEAQKATEILYEYVQKHNHESSKPYAFSEPVLKALQSYGVPMAVVSNKRHEPLNDAVEYLGWTHFFEIAIGAGKMERDKPHPASLFEAMKSVHENLSPAEILYIGDSETDLLTAQNAECDAALVQTSEPRPDLIEKYAPKYAWNDLNPLLEAAKEAA